MNWRLTHESLWFENQVATLELNGRQATLTFEKAVLDGSGEPGLRRCTNITSSSASRA